MKGSTNILQSNIRELQNPEFTEASTRSTITSGESIFAIFGKIKKWFSDLKAVAFSGSYNDLSDTPTIPAAQVNSDWNASSGVAQILNKPTIPTIPGVVSKTANGLAPQLPNETTITKYLRQDGSWVVPPNDNTTYPKAVKNITRSGTTFTATCYDGTTFTFTQQDNNTTYSANNGVGLSGTTFYNSGVRSIATGSSNGTISVNTNGTAANVAVKGLGSAAYLTADTAASKSTVALRDGNGYLKCVYLNTSNGAENISSYSGALVAFYSTDGWLRKTSQANFKTWLGSLPASDVYSWAKASSKPSYAWSEITSKPTFATAATANAVAQRDGSGHLTMNDCICNSVKVANSSEWLPLRGGGAITCRNVANNAYVQILATAFSVQSSRRYKENIVDMTDADAEDLLALRVVTFDYKEGIVDGDRTGQKGLIAEEVAEHETFPVTYNQDKEIEGLDYSKFVPQLIKLCQMQQRQIDDLTARLEAVERKVN